MMMKTVLMSDEDENNAAKLSDEQMLTTWQWRRKQCWWAMKMKTMLTSNEDENNADERWRWKRCWWAMMMTRQQCIAATSLWPQPISVCQKRTGAVWWWWSWSWWQLCSKSWRTGWICKDTIELKEDHDADDAVYYKLWWNWTNIVLSGPSQLSVCHLRSEGGPSRIDRTGRYWLDISGWYLPLGHTRADTIPGNQESGYLPLWRWGVIVPGLILYQVDTCHFGPYEEN